MQFLKIDKLSYINRSIECFILYLLFITDNTILRQVDLLILTGFKRCSDSTKLPMSYFLHVVCKMYKGPILAGARLVTEKTNKCLHKYVNVKR